MNWDDPNNFKFALTWLNAQAIRTQRFYEYFTPLGQIFSYKFNNWWQQVWPNAYALNATLESWQVFYPEEPPNDPLTFHPGPVWRESPSHYFKALALPNFGLLNPNDIRQDVEQKVGWQELEEWPSFEEIWAALRSQVYSIEPTPFPSFWGIDGQGYYREDFVLYLMRRSKLLWEADTPYQTFAGNEKCFLGAGRIALDPENDAPWTSYRSVVYFVVNSDPWHVKVFEVKPGCCALLRK